MLLRDPYALHVLCKSIINNLTKLSESSKLPRVSQVVGNDYCVLFRKGFMCVSSVDTVGILHVLFDVECGALG